MLNKKILIKPYSKVDVVILDNNCSNLNLNFVSHKIINSNEVNVYHLFFTLLKFIIFYFKGYKFSDLYFIELINHLDPKIGLGCDVDFRIYKFIKFFPQKKSIIYQFGFYNFEYIEIMKKNITNNFKKKKIKCNYFLIWHKKFKKYFKYFDTKFIISGSVRSNDIPRIKIKKIYDLLFVSTFRNSVKSYYGTNLHYLSMKVKDATSSYVLKILNKLQEKNKIKICVALSSNRNDKEKKINKKDEIEFIKRDLKKFSTNKENAYKLAEKSKLIISTHSTIGHELLSRGHKVLIINPDHFFYNQNILKNFNDKTALVTSYKESVISSNILKVLKMSDNKWKNLRVDKKSNIKFDKNNRILKSLIQRILIS